MKTIAIIPARGGSKGLKNKNILDLQGKPLIGYTISAALECDFIDEVIVSTDDEKIAKVAIDFGAKIPFLRPKHLATDESPTIETLKYTIEGLEKIRDSIIENIILLQPTSPLRTSIDIQEAYQTFIENDYTPVVSVCETQTHPYLIKKVENNYLKDLLNITNKPARRQDFPKYYELNGAIYITTRNCIIESGSLYTERVLPYVMEKHKSLDIDDILDFKLAEILLENGDRYVVQSRK